MINTSESRIIFNGNGTATEFPYSFAIINDTDVKVMTVDPDGVETVLDSDYYVDVTASKVIYPGYPPGEEPAESERPPVLPTGWQLVVYRDIPITQEANLGNVWPFNVIEGGLDKLTMIVQVLNDGLARSFSVSEATPADVKMVVPVEAGKAFRWSDDGKSLVTTEDPAKVTPQVQSLLAQAKEQASIATTQAQTATTQANNAANSATTAAGSADNAAQSAEEAAQIVENIGNPVIDVEAQADGSIKVTKVDGTSNSFKSGDVTQEGLGVWKANETVEQGEIRKLYGRENTGYLIEYLQGGTTGTTQPVVEDVTEIANWASFDRVGKLRFIFNLNDKDADEVLGCGILYNRNTYPELWEYAQLKNMVVTEAEWQAKLAENDGLFVPYYSDGDGSTTFRTPMYATYSCGVASSDDIGNYASDGLPNITGSVGANAASNGGFIGYSWEIMEGALSYELNSTGISFSSGSYLPIKELNFDASLSNSIYGNANEVRPKTMYGIWVIKAVGIVVDSGNTDLVNVLTGIEQIQQQITALQNQISDSNNFAIIYPNGGTEKSPAELSEDSRYVEENPFPGYYVKCEAQILINDKWGVSKCIMNSSSISAGVDANQLLPDDTIIIKTGNNNVYNSNSSFNGSPLELTTALPSAPCRVLVHKLGKIEGDTNV